MNSVVIIGNLGATPELRYTESGTAVTNLSVATNESYNNAEGERVDQTEWHRVVVWGKQAETCCKFLEKGRQVAVQGKIKTREWTTDEGEKRYTTEIVARNVKFLSGGSSQLTEDSEDDLNDIPF